VAVRGDRNPVGFADLEIVQNAASARGRRQHYLPHWSQPGLLKRDETRGQQVRTILFPGARENLLEEFRGATWTRWLTQRGLEFRCSSSGKDGQPADWHDYRQVDVIIAIRPSAGRQVTNKPGSKLFNAWLAGVPAILGPESGYRELRAGPLDYIEATGVDDTMAAIDRLLDDPALYQAMVDNGHARGAAFTDAATLTAWRTLINAVLVPAWEREVKRPAPLWRRWVRDLAVRVARAWGGKH
jgi:hypothetical protein